MLTGSPGFLLRGSSVFSWDAGVLTASGVSVLCRPCSSRERRSRLVLSSGGGRGAAPSIPFRPENVHIEKAGRIAHSWIEVQGTGLLNVVLFQGIITNVI